MKHLAYWARRLTDWLGSLLAFALSVIMLVAWLIWSVVTHFNALSQLVFNTVTGGIPYCLFFLILYVQNRDGRALNLKVDEVIRGEDAADNRYRRLESAEDDVIAALAEESEKCPVECREGESPSRVE